MNTRMTPFIIPIGLFIVGWLVLETGLHLAKREAHNRIEAELRDDTND